MNVTDRLMKVLSVVVVISLCSLPAFDTKAQESYRFTVKAGQTVEDVLSPERMYKFPEFEKGRVIYTNGTTTDALMNYNYFIAEMQFVTGKDTFSIANEESLVYIYFPQDTFIYNKGYLSFVAGNNDIRLLVKEYFKLADVKRKGAYGISSSTISTENLISYNDVTGSGRQYKLIVNEDQVYARKTDFYMKIPSGEIVPAKRSVILKSFPDHKDLIKKYIKDQSIKFSRREDLVELTGYLQKLYEP